MRLVKNGLIGLVLLIAVLAGGGFLLPAECHVERETVIDATPEEVFAFLIDHREFNRWSPWAERDPNTKYEYSGPTSGVGAKAAWSSEDPNVGSGASELVEVVPYEKVRMHLDFGDQGTATAYYTLTPKDGGTHIVWAFDTNFGNNLIARYMGLMFDDWVGGEYEKGLANLKKLAES